MKIIGLAASAVVLLLSSGCATILNEETQNVNLSTSNGEETTVIINNKTHNAPGIVALVRSKEDLILAANGENCKGKTIASSSVDSVFFINILSGGAFGSSTDYSSDEMWEYDDNIVINCQ